jgi:hypothetical protein
LFASYRKIPTRPTYRDDGNSTIVRNIGTHTFRPIPKYTTSHSRRPRLDKLAYQPDSCLWRPPIRSAKTLLEILKYGAIKLSERISLRIILNSDTRPKNTRTLSRRLQILKNTVRRGAKLLLYPGRPNVSCRPRRRQNFSERLP